MNTMPFTYDSQAIYNLGLCFFYGRGVAKKRERGIHYFQEAAGLGNKDAEEALRKLSSM